MSDTDWDELINFDDWMDDWWKTLSFRRKVGYVLMGVWLRYISWPLQDAAYTVWRWVGEKCDWLELVYWELEVEEPLEHVVAHLEDNLDREIPPDQELTCDWCGKSPAYDFMGDFYCEDCANEYL